MTTEIDTIDGEIIEQRAPMTLFGTDQPEAVVERASAIATALAAVIKERKLSTKISAKEHVQVEGWTLLGSMLGVFAEIEWSRPLENGWEARAVARTLNGNVVGAAEAMCTSNEGRWKSADNYAVRSMAQTRAVSKALRMPLGFIMHLAGYSPTPAEEVPEDQPERGRSGSPSSPSASAPVRTPEEARMLDELLAVEGMTKARLSLLADAVGVPKGERANAAQLSAMLDIVNQPPSLGSAHPGDAETTPPSESVSSETATPDGSGAAPPVSPEPSAAPTMDDILAVTGGEEVPPKPNTAAYGALSAPQKASARAYWQKHSEVAA